MIVEDAYQHAEKIAVGAGLLAVGVTAAARDHAVARFVADDISRQRRRKH